MLRAFLLVASIAFPSIDKKKHFSPPPAFPFRENIRRLRCFLASSHANTKPYKPTVQSLKPMLRASRALRPCCASMRSQCTSCVPGPPRNAASFARVATLVCQHALAMYVMRPPSPCSQKAASFARAATLVCELRASRALRPWCASMRSQCTSCVPGPPKQRTRGQSSGNKRFG